MSGVDVLAVMGHMAYATQDLPAGADLREARAAVAELIAEAQRVVDGTTGDMHYLRAALARCGGAK